MRKGPSPRLRLISLERTPGIASSAATREAIEGSDCLLTVGYRRIESTTGFFTDKLPASAIHMNSSYVDTADKNYQGVYLAELLQSLVDSVFEHRREETAGSSVAAVLSFVPSHDPLTQDAYWKAMQSFLRPGDVIVVEDGTSSAGFGRLTLPDDCTYITGAFVWCSIGYATGALLGAILATPGRRHILLTGEGSLQMTVQEISTVMRHGLKPWIFVNQNEGYTVERCVLGKDAKYNEIATWRYSELPHVFGRDKKAETYVVTTSHELQNVLDTPHSEMVFVECVMDKFDAPIDLILGGHAIADADYGARGPQTTANAQIALPRVGHHVSKGRTAPSPSTQIPRPEIQGLTKHSASSGQWCVLRARGGSGNGADGAADQRRIGPDDAVADVFATSKVDRQRQSSDSFDIEIERFNRLVAAKAGPLEEHLVVGEHTNRRIAQFAFRQLKRNLARKHETVRRSHSAARSWHAR